MFESKSMYVLRSIAIFSVLCAHSSYVTSNSLSAIYNSRLLLLLGLVGVPIFFINSGYFFYKKPHISYRLFIRKKLIKIIIPWLVLTSIVYLYIVLRKPEASFLGYVKFIIGIGNYTYFLTVLLVFYLTFLKIKLTNLVIAIGSVISLISIFLTSTGNLSFIDPYINPLNWLIYFLAGVVLSKYNLLMPIIKVLEPLKYYLLILLLIIIGTIIYKGYYSYYWNPSAFVFIPFFIIVALSFLGQENRFFRLLIRIGKITLPIYLLHSLFIGGIVFFTNYYKLEFLIPLRPIIALLITLFAIQSYKVFIRKLRIEKTGLILIGLEK